MSGPHVQLATFCEQVLQESSGVISLIRVLDRITILAQGVGPENLPEGGRVNATLVVSLKSGDARGRSTIELVIEQPSGVRLPPQHIDMTFEGEERGVQLIAPVQLDAMEGLYWVYVILNGETLTQVPLRVMYQRVPGVA